MEYNFTTTFLGLLLIIFIDGIYLNFNKSMYDPILDKSVDINIIYGILAWLTIVISIQLIVLSRNDISDNNVFINGALLGFAMYALYNFTNAATYPNKWTNKIIVFDTLWGTILTGSMATVLYKLQNAMQY
jgi:uncharacterized membrane protein